MLIKHFFTEKIAHSSYMLVGDGTCAVIDPQRDADIYIEEARAQGVVITHIMQTHLHADFISGHMDLARLTGADIYIAKSAGCTFRHKPLSEGDTVWIENMKIDVLETPGHTPEHLSYVVIDTSRAGEPVGVFVGDTMFVGDVGRPDLFPDMAGELAGKLYHSLHDKLLKLPDFCEVYPAHGAGSLCGRSMGAKQRSTIGYERRFNNAIQIGDKTEFIKSLMENMPPAPDHFSRCSDINRKGPALLMDTPEMEELDVEAFRRRVDADDAIVVDVRSYHAFGSQHVPGAWSLDSNGNLPTFAGWVLPGDKEIYLVAENHKTALDARKWFRRVGLDNVVGYLKGGIPAWAVAGMQSSSVRQLSAEDLHDMAKGERNFILLDVRAEAEFMDSHITGAVNIPAADLRTRHDELDKDKMVLVICSSGNRSSLATSILKQHGFKNVRNVAGGMTGYSAAGYVKQCHVCENPHGSRSAHGVS
jgi:glyoxylase-like metal-dependent hydrolase (beta-lactamase superfamily II)/rhodanese-related sulfurtransferase